MDCGPSSVAVAAVGATLLGGALPATVEIVFCPNATFASKSTGNAAEIRKKYRQARLVVSLTQALLMNAHTLPLWTRK